MQIETNGRISKHWTSQAAAQAIIAEAGCKLCNWHFPGWIYDVAGDLWCEHCVREHLRELPDLEPALIPTP